MFFLEKNGVRVLILVRRYFLRVFVVDEEPIVVSFAERVVMTPVHASHVVSHGFEFEVFVVVHGEVVEVEFVRNFDVSLVLDPIVSGGIHLEPFQRYDEHRRSAYDLAGLDRLGGGLARVAYPFIAVALIIFVVYVLFFEELLHAVFEIETSDAVGWKFHVEDPESLEVVVYFVAVSADDLLNELPGAEIVEPSVFVFDEVVPRLVSFGEKHGQSGVVHVLFHGSNVQLVVIVHLHVVLVEEECYEFVYVVMLEEAEIVDSLHETSNQ